MPIFVMIGVILLVVSFMFAIVELCQWCFDYHEDGE
jgi:uncharacterized membrane protein